MSTILVFVNLRSYHLEFIAHASGGETCATAVVIEPGSRNMFYFIANMQEFRSCKAWPSLFPGRVCYDCLSTSSKS